MMYLKVDNVDEAENCFDFAIALNKQNVEALETKGGILMNKGEYEDALEYLEKAAIYEEIDPALWCQVGLCYRSLEKFDEAKVSYLEAIRQDETYGESYFGLGVLAYESDDYNKSIDYLKKAISLADYLSEAYLFLGHCYDQLDDLIAAEEAYQSAYDIDSNDENTINLLYILYMNDKIDRVVELAVQHINLEPNALILMMYACILFDLGYGKESLEFMSNALEFDKESANVINDFFPHLLQEIQISDLLNTLEV